MRYLIIILWLLLGVFYWYVSKQCCIGDTSSAVGAATGAAAAAATAPCPNVTPYSFNWGSAEPIQKATANWDSLSNALSKGLQSNQNISITGMYRNGEENTSTYENLGLARANAILTLLGLDAKKIKLGASKVNAGKRDKDCSFAGASVSKLVESKNVKEEVIKDEYGNMSKRTTIYFPFNSTNKLNDGEVESYLNTVAARVKKSGERVQLTGHTDNIGENAPNIALGQRRADIVKDYLIKKGVSPSKIIANSKGESSPIATNDSDQGRAKNRRTELQIIK